MSEEKTTIGLTPGNKRTMEEVLPYFNEQMDAAQFAMAIAIEQGSEPKPIDEVETVWNIGSFDPDYNIRNLIQALYPDVDEPTRALECFINQGFHSLDDHLMENKEIDILDLI